MHRIAFLAAGLALAAAPTAHATDISTQCETDIATHCGNVAPGNGRILSCLYAHEDLLSEACDRATSESSDLLDYFFHRLRIVIAACSPDIHRHCADVAVGQGRLFSCLAERRAELGADCAELVDEIELPTDS